MHQVMKKTDRILKEASAVAENSINDKFPDLPTSTNGTSTTEN